MKSECWWKYAVFYELYVDKFAGNFNGLAEKLNYFTALGVDCLHILPHYPSPMVDDGYDISDYRAVRSDLGTLDDFRAFTAAAHERGIRVMIDFVLNHISAEHPWFKEARSSKDNPRRDYFLWSETGTELKNARNVFSFVKPSNWIYNPATKDYYFATFYAEQPDLNWNNPAVFEDMTAVMDFWIEHGVDGFRLDAAPYLIKKEETNSQGLPETHAVIGRLRAHLAKHPDVILLSEVNAAVSEMQKYFGTNKCPESHLSYHFSLAQRLILAAVRDDPALVDEMIAAPQSIPAFASWAVFLRNHDQMALDALTPAERAEVLNTRVIDPRYAFSVENGFSVRLATLFKNEQHKLRVAFKMLLSLPMASIIYYGEEIGMENDTTLGVQSDSRRFVRGVFDWAKAEAQMNDPDSLFSFVAARVREHKATVLIPTEKVIAIATD